MFARCHLRVDCDTRSVKRPIQQLRDQVDVVCANILAFWNLAKDAQRFRVQLLEPPTCVEQRVTPKGWVRLRERERGRRPAGTVQGEPDDVE